MNNELIAVLDLFRAPWRSVGLHNFVDAAPMVGAAFAVIFTVLVLAMLRGDARERRLGMLLAIFMGTGLSLNAKLAGTIYYVRDTTACANNGDGTAYACAASNGAAGAIRNFANMLLATFAPGDTVYICGALISSNSFQWTNAMESGTAGAPITVDGHCPVGNGTYDEGSFATTAAYALRVVTTGPDYIRLKRLTFSDGTTDNLSFNLGTTTGWVLEDIVSQDTAGDGVDIDDAADGGIRIDGLTIYRAAANGLMCNSMAGWQWRNIRVYDSGTSGANNHDGIGINDGCASGSYLSDWYVSGQKGNLGGGLDVQDSTGTGQITVENGEATEGEGSGYTATCNAGAMIIRAHGIISHNNDLYGVYLKDCTNGQHNLSHFTTFGNGVTELKVGDTGTSGDSGTVTVGNSIFGGATCTGEAVFWRNNASLGLTSNYNLFCENATFSLVSGGIVDFAGWKAATSQDANSLQDDPEFVGVGTPDSAEDVCLKSTSPALAAGSYSGAWDTGYANEDLGNPTTIGARGQCLGRAPAASRAATPSRAEVTP